MSTMRRYLWKRKELSVIGSVSGCFTHTPLGVTWTSSFTDEGGTILTESENPDWRRDIAQGRSATTPFNANEISIQFGAGFCDSSKWCNKAPPADRWGVETLSGFLNDGFADVTTPSAPSTSIDPVVDAQARLAFIKRARSAQGSFRGATFLAELADTLRTIRNPARALRSSVDEYGSVARRRIRNAIGRDPRGVRARDLTRRQSRAASRALSDSWLEAQYGWLPLAGDIRDAMKAYDRFSRRVELSRIDAEGSSRSALSISLPASASNNLSFRTEVHTSTESSVHYYGAVKVNMSSFSSGLAEEAGLRFRDFVPALWEWIPYSFLVDYFTNIGDIIEAASFPKSDLAWCARTYRNTAVRDGSRMTCRVTSSNAYPLTGYTRLDAFYPSSIIIRRKYVSRAAFVGSFVPSFQIEIPGSRGFKKYLNIGALALSRGMRR